MMASWELSCKVNTLHPPEIRWFESSWQSGTPLRRKSGSAASAGESSSGSSRRWKPCQAS
jgi:hypothetical protein